MQLSDLFEPDDLIVDFAPADKWDAIRGLVEHLRERGRLTEEIAREVLEAVEARERSMSTGMEHGVAIPHAAVQSVETVAACLGIVRDPAGLSFESIDGRPTRLIVLLVIPRAQKLLHIRTLADVARVLGRENVREALLLAETSQAAWDALEKAEVEDA